MNDNDQRHEGGARGWIPTFVTLAFLAIAGFFLLTEHRAHLFGALPFLLLLACPLLHAFMHRGHGGHDDDDPAGRGARPSNPSHQH